MEFFKTKTNINFLGVRKYTTILSIVMVVASLVLLFARGLNMGLDFTGGYQVQATYSTKVDVENIAKTLNDNGFPHAEVTTFGSEGGIMIKMPPKSFDQNKHFDDYQKQIKDKIESLTGGHVDTVNYIGPQVGSELASNGVLAVVVAIISILIYISIRFETKFAISACVALLHDPILILGVFAAFQLEFNLTVLAAILAVIGYSLNDTVVIYDRVRENFRKMRSVSTVEMVNKSINDTLSRTILTSGLTLMVVFVLFFFGGASIHEFSLALILGVVVGTYSSIYIAGMLAVVLGLDRSSLVTLNKSHS